MGTFTFLCSLCSVDVKLIMEQECGDAQTADSTVKHSSSANVLLSDAAHKFSYKARYVFCDCIGVAPSLQITLNVDMIFSYRQTESDAKTCLS